MGAVKICIVLVCLVAAGGNWGFGCGVVEGGERIVKLKTEDYERIIRIAAKEIGVVEGARQNDGKRIREYLGYCYIKSHAAWCAAYLSFCFGQAGYKQPRTAWSPSLFPASRLVKEPKPGVVYGIYFASLKRIAHCGLVEFVKNDLVYGLEGNTNLAGSREGDGVFRKIRHKRTIYRYADWLD